MATLDVNAGSHFILNAVLYEYDSSFLIIRMNIIQKYTIKEKRKTK